MKYFSKKYRLILILSFLVVFLASIKYLYKPDWSQENQQNQITPTPAVTQVQTNVIDLDKDYPLNGILPYYGKTFDIKNYSNPLSLVVKIKSESQEEVTKEMMELFEKQGVDLNSHKFEWIE